MPSRLPGVGPACPEPTPLENLVDDQVYTLTMANDAQQRYPEFNVRFKTDSSRNGPEAGKLARRYAGMRGDRAQVIFGSLDDLMRQPDASSTRRAWRRG